MARRVPGLVVLSAAILLLAAFRDIPVLSQDALPRVLFDEAHDEVNTLSESRARQIDSAHPEFYYFGALAEAVSRDYALERGLSRLDSSFLAGFDVVVVSTPRAAFQQQELDALKAFVENGGGLLLLQGSSPSPTTGSNQIAELFGVSFRSGPLLSRNGDWDAGSFRADVADPTHMVTLGCSSFQMNWGCSIVATSDCDVLLASKADTWQDTDGNKKADTAEPSGSLPVAVAMTAGRGRAVLVGDNSFHNNLWNQNGALFVNALRWLTPLASGGEPRTTYAFTVDQDVTRDSVVQIGDGPQVLSTDVKFYPNTRRAKPGDTVYWRLELGSLEGPFTITPEMDNNHSTEAPIRTDVPSLILPFTYGEANIYTPFLSVRDCYGTTRIIRSRNVLGVLPNTRPRESAGFRIPTPESPTGDYIKGFNVASIAHDLFDSSSGRAWLEGELDRVRGLGANTLVFNIHWFAGDTLAPMQEPIYYGAWPAFHQDTVTLRNLSQLCEWTQERGMKVGIRLFLVIKGNYDCSLRQSYAPSDLALYANQQEQIRTLYGELASSLGVALFDLAAEEPAFSSLEEGSSVIESLSSVYDGVVTTTPTEANDGLYSCPYVGALDLIGCTSFILDSSGSYEDTAQQVMSDIAVYAFQNEFEQLLLREGRSGYFGELGVAMRTHGNAEGVRRYRAYFEALRELVQDRSPIVGVVWWDWSLSKEVVGLHCPRGTPAEAVIREYFTEVLPDEVTADFGARPAVSPRQALVLDTFEGAGNAYEVWENGSDLAYSFRRTDRTGGSGLCLRATLVPSGDESVRYGFIWRALERSQDWAAYSSLCFWLRSDTPNWGVEVDVIDSDGDRFNTRIDTRPYLQDVEPSSHGWHLVSIPLEFFYQPDWAAGSGDGAIDWSSISRWGLGFVYSEHGAQTIWLDDLYLSFDSAVR